MHIRHRNSYRTAIIFTAALAVSLASLLMAGLDYLAEAEPLPQPLSDGQSIFQQKCAACHTIGGGKSAGPDLKGVSARLDREWVKSFIAAPDKLIAQKDPTAMRLLQENNNVPMPNMGISEADADLLIEYIDVQGGTFPASKPAQTQPTAPSGTSQTPAAVNGSASSGRALFDGGKGFKNGSPPCIACHAIAGNGAVGGGTMGPDLTQTYKKYGGDAGVASVLAGLPFPTMKPIYDSRPLTPEEQADLRALFQASSAQQPGQSALLIALLAGGGLLVFLVTTQLVWRRRVTSVRKSLTERT